MNESVRVHLSDNNQTFEIDKSDRNNAEDIMTVEVMGDMPKVVGFNDELTIQVCNMISSFDAIYSFHLFYRNK